MKLELIVSDENVTGMEIIADHEEDRQQVRRVANVMFDELASEKTDNGARLVLTGESFVVPDFSVEETAEVALADGKPSQPLTAAEIAEKHRLKAENAG